MDSLSGVAFILATLILTNELAPVVGCCWQRGDRASYCCCGCSITAIAITVYRAWSVFKWAWDFGEFLKDKDIVNRPRDLQELPIWLLDHPPPFEMKFKIILFILRYVLLGTETQTRYRDHAYLKEMNCGSKSYCETGRDILIYFYGIVILLNMSIK